MCVDSDQVTQLTALNVLESVGVQRPYLSSGGKVQHVIIRILM